jgi:hypothetical protein
MIVVTSGLLAKASMYPPLPLSRERSWLSRSERCPSDSCFGRKAVLRDAWPMRPRKIESAVLALEN